VSEPIGRELLENKLDQVDKGGLKVPEGEGSGMGMSANLGTKVNRRKRAVRLDPNIVEDVSLKQGDEGDGMVIKVDDTGDKAKEILFYKFFRWYPELLSMVVNDLVLVRVTVDGISAGRSSEEVGKKVD